MLLGEQRSEMKKKKKKTLKGLEEHAGHDRAGWRVRARWKPRKRERKRRGEKEKEEGRKKRRRTARAGALKP